MQICINQGPAMGVDLCACSPSCPSMPTPHGEGPQSGPAMFSLATVSCAQLRHWPSVHPRSVTNKV